MKIIDLYIIRKFLGTFFYSIALLILIVIVFDLSENLDKFIKHNAPLSAIIFDNYLNFIPYFINLFIYLFTFISVIFFTSKLAGNSEIIAILSSGISFWRLLVPYIISAVLLSILSFYLGNFLIPKANHTRRLFKDKYMTKLTSKGEKNKHLQLEPGVFAYVESYNKDRNSGFRFTLEKFDGQKLVYKLSAQKIVYNKEKDNWTVKDYFVRKFTGDKEVLEKGTKMDTTLNMKPSDFYKIKEYYEEMNMYQLDDYIKKEKLKGSLSYKKYEVEKYKRLASPAATIILTFIGMALSSRKVRGGIGLHLGIGIALTFSYILFMQISTVFSTYGDLPASVGAWIPNIIYSIIAVYLLITAPK